VAMTGRTYKPRNPWKTLSQRTIYENGWVRVREDVVIRPGGGHGIYGVVEIRPSVGIVALNERDEIVLVGQWRYPIDRYSLEIPRGGSQPGELDMMAVAKRELSEETGVEAQSWQPLGAVEVCNGVTTDVQHLFLARDLRLVETHQDPLEEIVSQWRPYEEAVDMVMRGEVTEVCSVAAILKVARLF
jgi:8-oxo-dGTP pyrophosphatase MutT (NUDIX family)